jgi:hypothetical protein
MTLTTVSTSASRPTSPAARRASAYATRHRTHRRPRRGSGGVAVWMLIPLLDCKNRSGVHAMKTKLELSHSDLQSLIAKVVGVEPVAVRLSASADHDALDRPTGGHNIRCEIEADGADLPRVVAAAERGF